MEINYDQIKEKLKDFDLQTKAQLVSLVHHLQKRKQLDEQQDKELDDIEINYLKQSDPLKEKQNQIISGERAPVEEELKELPKYLKEDEQIDLTNKEAIPSYWQKVLSNSKSLSQIMGKRDGAILNDLLMIEGYDDKTKETCGLKFTFKQNEHFQDTILTVDFILDTKTNEPKSITSTKINWNPGKNVAAKIVKKKKKKVTKTKEVEQQSFFTIFRNLNVDSEEFKKMDQEKQSELQTKLDMSFEVARLIHDEVLPYSLEYYLDVHVEDEDEFDPDMGEEDSEEDEEDISKEEAIRRMKEKRGFKK